jgi:hypothetical protein
LYRRLRAIEKNERHSIAHRKPDQFARRFRGADLFRVFDDSGELLLEFTLFVEEQLRVTDHVHEQDMPDLQMNIGFRVSGHIAQDALTKNPHFGAARRDQSERLPEAHSVRYAKFYSRSHDAAIRVYDDAGNVIETHEQRGDFKEP